MSTPDDAPWVVEVAPEARRQLARLPARPADQIITYIYERLALNPMRLSGPLRGDLAAMRSARQGPFRVLIYLVPDDRVMRVARIEHRADVYRPR